MRTELLAGLTTFMTMAYIIFVNPAIWPMPAWTGCGVRGHPPGRGARSALMGLYANYPVALAPGIASTPTLPTAGREMGTP